jgi:hypothetical protein
MPPTIPVNHYFAPGNQQNRNEILFYYPMLMYSVAEKKFFACFEHSNLLKVNEPELRKGATEIAPPPCEPPPNEEQRRVSGKMKRAGGSVLTAREGRRTEDPTDPRRSRGEGGGSRRVAPQTTAPPAPTAPRSNYELFNRNNFNIRY